jgi:translocation and assembly module TamA
MSRRKRLARALRWAGLALLTTVVLGLGLLASLSTPSGRRWVLRQASEMIEERTGVRAEADDFRLRLRRPRLELDGVRAAMPAASVPAPFLTVERATAELRWRALFADTVVIDSIRLERPQLDLGAPLPEALVAEETDEEAGIDLEVVELELTDAAVLGGEVGEELDVWLDSWRVEEIHLSGSYTGGAADLRLDESRITIASARRPEISARALASARLEPGASVQVESLSLEGDGLSFAGSGEVELGTAMRFDAELDLRAEPGRLVPDLATGGLVGARGSASGDEAHVDGDLELSVRDLPVELLRPWLDQAGLEELDVSQSSLDVGADLDLRMALGDEARPPQIGGSAAATWSRGEQTLVELAANTVDSSQDPDFATQLVFEGQVLPHRTGSRSVAGRLLLADWEEPERSELRDGRVQIQVVDLRDAAREIGLAEDDLEAWGVDGSLEVSGRIEGPLLRPTVDADAAWTLGETRLLQLAARAPDGIDLTQEEAAVLDVEASLLGSLAGERTLRARLGTGDWTDLATTRLLSSQATIAIPDLAAFADEARRLIPALAESIPDRPTLLAGAVEAELAASGPLLGPEVDARATWRPATDELIELSARAQLQEEAPFFVGPALADLRIAGFDLSRLEITGEAGELLAGRLDSRGSFEGELDEHVARLTVDAAELRYGPELGAEAVHLEASSDGRRATVADAEAILRQGDASWPLRARGAVDITQPLQRAEAWIEVQDLLPDIPRVTFDLRLEDGTLKLAPARVELAGSAGEPAELEISAAIPLGALTALPGLEQGLSALPLEPAEGPITADLAVVELASLAHLLGASEDTFSMRGRMGASLSLDPSRLAQARGRLLVRGLTVETPQGRIYPQGELELQIGDGQARLPRLAWATVANDGKQNELVTSATARLASGWQLGEPAPDLLEHLDFDAGGTLDASLLNPLLAGGVASGPVELGARFRGNVAEPEGRLTISAPGASIRYFQPYTTRIEAPEIVVVFRSGEATLEKATARMNRGDLRLSGGVSQERGVELAADLRGVRYRLDHGLTTLLDADLALDSRTDQTPRLSGELIVQRASLRRDLRLEREVLSLLFGPPDLDTTEPGAIDDWELDLVVSTSAGARIQNNLADLRVDWSPLRVRGTLGQPSVRGRFEIDPGGRITAYGQTVRIDEASIQLSGDPDLEPRVILETTSSLEDPTLNQDDRWYTDTGWGQRSEWATGFSGPSEGASSEALASGVRTHYTERLASALGRHVPGVELSYQALPIFGDSDTQSRLTLSQRLSPNVTYINSRNPREAEGTTNLIELHGFAPAPGVIGQLFRNDDGNQGAALQQSHLFGRGVAGDKTVLGRIEIATEGLPERRLRRATGLRRGDPLPEGSDFDVEVDLEDHLRRRGNPGARVRASKGERSGRRVDLRVEIDPGPNVQVDFEGDLPPRRRRREIAALYQPERFADAISIQEMRRTTVNALRAMGFLHPEVEIEATPVDPENPRGDRRVVVTSRGGRRVQLERPIFEGADEEVAAVARLFATALERVELAAGSPGADAFLLRSLSRIGYPEAEVLSRHISEDGTELRVAIEPGSRRTVGEVEVTVDGVDADLAQRLRKLADLAVGTPLRADLVGRAASDIDDQLREAGHSDAYVEVELEDLTPDRAGATRVRFVVEAGPRFTMEQVEIDGLASSYEPWVERVADLETGSKLTLDELGDARRRLHRTGVFDRVGVSTDPLSNSPSSPLGEGSDWTAALVTFELEERPRYQVSYGARWESGESLGGAVYLSDRNFLGRGRTLGFRGIYMNDQERSLGIYHGWPGIGGSKALFELFAQAFTDKEIGILTEGVESWGQITLPRYSNHQSRFYTLFQDRSFEDLATGLPADDDAESLFLGWQWTHDTRDRALGVGFRDGSMLTLDISATADGLVSDFDELRAFGQWKTLVGLGSDRLHRHAEGPLAWAQSVRVGWLETFGGSIPRVDRLTAGGEFSIRGYPSESIGPLDEDGRPLGGEIMVIFNQELHVPLWSSIDAVVFFDAGNVWESPATLDSELFTATGLGLRTPSPVGPLRLDLAFPLDRRPEIDPSYRVYFGFGTTF